MKNKNISKFWILTILIFSVLIVSCKTITEKEFRQVPPEPSSPLQAKLSLSENPLLNKPVTLTLSFKSIIDAPNTFAKIILPNEFEVVSGNLEWKGDLSKDIEQKIETQVKATKVGYYQLHGSAFSRQGESYYFGDVGTIDVEITPDNAIIGSKPKNNWHDPSVGMAIPLPENNEQIESELTISSTPELNKEFTIIYRVTPLINLPDPERTYMSLVLPPKGFEILNVQFSEGGETYENNLEALNQFSWEGSIDKGQTIEIKANLKVIDTGWGNLYGHLNVQPSGEITELIQDVKIADLYVDRYKGNFTIYEPKPRYSTLNQSEDKYKKA